VGKMVFNHCGWAKEPINRLLGVLWMWERFSDQSGENDIVVEDPSRYTLELLPKGVFRIRADCNTGSGTYYLSGSQLTLTLGALTRAYCGDDSLHDQYLAMLKDVVTYVMDDEGKLVLNLKADAGNMIFGQGNGAVAETAVAMAAPAADTGLDAGSVTLDTQGLPYSWQANVVPATPYDNSQPPGTMGLPEHIQINFGVTDPADKKPGDPVMYVIPVQSYQQLWEAQGDPGVSVLLETQQKMLQDRPTPFPPAGIPVLPFEELGGTNDLAVQGAYLDLPAMSGMRFVGRFSQGPNPVTNEGLRYIYQGYAGDANQYIVAFFYPVSTTALPDSAGEVPASDMDRLNADPSAYMQEQAETLNGLAGTDWQPNLSVLDAVVASLNF
jgi:heat shock protein HslJ